MNGNRVIRELRSATRAYQRRLEVLQSEIERLSDEDRIEGKTFGEEGALTRFWLLGVDIENCLGELENILDVERFETATVA